MLSKLLIAWFLMALCVAIHAVGLVLLFGRLKKRPAVAGDGRIWPSIRRLVDVAGWMILLHLIEIALWALLYTVGQAMPDIQSASYFSMVTYTTTGYGDLVLPPEWRLVGGIEALTGILMCGLSTGVFFTVVNRMYGLKPGSDSDR